MEAEGLLPCPQQPATYPVPEPDQVHAPTLSLEDSFQSV